MASAYVTFCNPNVTRNKPIAPDQMCVQYDSSISWTVPTWLKLALSSILFIGCFFIPESRRQYSHGQIEKCRQTLNKYHSDQNTDSCTSSCRCKNLEGIELKGPDKRWWYYRTLFNSKASLYRVLLCACASPAFSQWTGQGGVSYFLPAMLIAQDHGHH
jgi:hypothetical protein